MIYIAFFSDPAGLPRAYGQSTSPEDAEAIAKLELEAYRDEKRAVGDPLADARFTLEVKTLQTAAELYGGFRVVKAGKVVSAEDLNEGNATELAAELGAEIEHQDPETKEWKRW